MTLKNILKPLLAIFCVTFVTACTSSTEPAKKHLTEGDLINSGFELLTGESLASLFNDKTVFGWYRSTPVTTYGENGFLEHYYPDGTLTYKYCEFADGAVRECGKFVNGEYVLSNKGVCFSYPQSNIFNRCFEIYTNGSTHLLLAKTYKHAGYVRAELNRIEKGIVREKPYYK